MRVLVTGGAGFIGSHIVDALLARGHSVAVIDDLSAGKLENLNADARLYRVDITDAAALREVFAKERPTLVNHHAAQTDVRRSMADPAFDARVNLLGTLNVLEAAAAYGVTRLLFASTCAVYSEPECIPMDEGHPIGSQSAYGLSKHAAEGYIRLYGATRGIAYKIMRYGNVYGPRQNPKGEAGVVAIFAGQLLKDQQPTIFGDGNKTRDYVFVEDVVAANLAAMREVGDHQVFNVAGGTEVTDFEIFDAVRRATGVYVEPEYARKRPGEAERVSLDCSRARSVLGWKPTVALEEGIGRAVTYYSRLSRGEQGGGEG